MNDKKIAFIICANDENELKECEYYISRLIVPKEYQIEMFFVWDAASMTSGYQEAMSGSDAKYKVYLHQDVFIINQNFIAEMLGVFLKNPEIGMLGCVGSKKIDSNRLLIQGWDTGKVFHNLIPAYIDFDSESIRVKGYEKVQVIDGLLLATQYDTPWREDLFDGWDFYDASQAMEMQKLGKEVVVPYQKIPWCYHDNKTSKMKDYYRNYEIFLSEYLNEKAAGKFVHSEKSLEFEKLQEKLKEVLNMLLETGNREAHLKIFAEEESRRYLSLREYKVIADIERVEKEKGIEIHFWEAGVPTHEILEKVRKLKFLLKRLEYDAEEGTEYTYLQEHYSKAAILAVMDEYIWEKEKVANKIQRHR